MTAQAFTILASWVLVTVAAIHAYGWLSGFAIGAAVYVLTPWGPRS